MPPKHHPKPLAPPKAKPSAKSKRKKKKKKKEVPAEVQQAQLLDAIKSRRETDLAKVFEAHPTVSLVTADADGWSPLHRLNPLWRLCRYYKQTSLYRMTSEKDSSYIKPQLACGVCRSAAPRGQRSAISLFCTA